MKKLLYLFVCASVVITATSCNNRNKNTRNAGETARSYAQHIQNGQYDRFLDAVVFEEEPYTAAKPVPEKAIYSKVLRTKVEPMIREKGGIKDIQVVKEDVSNDGQTANVVLRQNYNNGQSEDMTYDLIWHDNAWRIKMDNGRHVWKTKTPDGRDVKFTLKEGDDRFVYKEDVEGEDRQVLKVIDDDNRHVVKVKDGDHKEVTKVIEKDDETVIKHKEDGEKEVTRIPKE